MGKTQNRSGMAWLLTTAAILVSIPLSATPTRLQISKLQGSISVDGDLSDTAWSSASRVDEFYEYFKGDNQTPPVKTTALLAYDSSFLYIAFRADDPHPHRIRAPFVDRDNVLGDQDFVAVLLDTNDDRRSAISFRVNPRGVQTDALTNDANGVEDFSPDFFYEAVARRNEGGWTVEMRIPMSTLRYPPRDPQQWGIILMRNYPRDFRYIMSNTPIPKGSNCFVCHASELGGLSGLPGGGHLTAAPYVTAQGVSHRDNRPGQGSMVTDPTRSDLGVDLKWTPNATLVIDGTLNPDFSQLESDVPQIAVNNRFALSFPEKRSFFLEGVDLLSTPIQAVHTRSITSPRWGLRATGHSAATSWTMLASQDRGGGVVILPSTYGSDFVAQDFSSLAILARVRRSLGTSFAGFLLSAREIDGGGYNRVLGPDFQWRISPKDRITGQFLYSSTENPVRPDLSNQLNGQSSSSHAARISWSRDSLSHDVWANVETFGDGFRADNGFVPQVGYSSTYLEAARHFYPKGPITFLRTYALVEYGIDSSGTKTRSSLAPGFFFEGKWNSNGWISFRLNEEERVSGRLLDFGFLRFGIGVNPSRTFPNFRVEGELGDRIDYAHARVGRGGKLDATATVRPSDRFEVKLNHLMQWVDVDEEEGNGRLFNAQVERIKMTYSFSARSLIRLIGQYTDIDRDQSLFRDPIIPREGGVSASALYGYKLNWQTVFFLGYGDNSLLEGTEDYVTQDRSLFMKISYAFQR